jgi:hypothetical protein
LLETPPTRRPPSPPALLLEIPPARRPPPRRARGEDVAGEEAPPCPAAAYDAGEEARPMAGGSMKPTSSSSAGSLQRRLRPPSPLSNLFPRPATADHDGPHRGRGGNRRGGAGGAARESVFPAPPRPKCSRVRLSRRIPARSRFASPFGRAPAKNSSGSGAGALPNGL